MFHASIKDFDHHFQRELALSHEALGVTDADAKQSTQSTK